MYLTHFTQVAKVPFKHLRRVRSDYTTHTHTKGVIKIKSKTKTVKSLNEDNNKKIIIFEFDP